MCHKFVFFLVVTTAICVQFYCPFVEWFPLVKPSMIPLEVLKDLSLGYETGVAVFSLLVCFPHLPVSVERKMTARKAVTIFFLSLRRY